MKMLYDTETTWTPEEVSLATETDLDEVFKYMDLLRKRYDKGLNLAEITHYKKTIKKAVS